MRFELLFPSKYLAAADLLQLPNRQATVTIERIFQDELQAKTGLKEMKVMAKFAEFPKVMVVNRTCGKAIAKLWGPETDEWVGKKVTLVAMMVEAFGEMTMAIRVSPEKPGSNGHQTFNEKVTTALDSITPQPVSAS